MINCYFKKFSQLREEFDKDLYAVQSIQILGRNIPISTLRHNVSNHYHKKSSYVNHKTKGIKSFIAFSDKFNFLKSPSIPLPIPLKEDMKIYIQLANKNKIELGSIKALDTYEKFLFFMENI